MSVGRDRPATPNDADDAYKVERSRLLLAFGEKLRAERERRNLSQEALAEITHVHRTHIGALELGLRDPHLSMLLILAKGLGIRPGALLEGLFVPKERKAATNTKIGRAGARRRGRGEAEATTGIEPV
jgi:transcriptional regulator with XRE-family HTH domain